MLHAQNATDSIATAIVLDEIVVSDKETFRHNEIPASVSLLRAGKLERERISSLKNLSTYVPNFFIPDYGSKLYAPVYIRGIGTRTGAPSVGLYVDGVPYLETTAFDFDFFDIEHIEVLRGPQGTLYGRNTMAGIINVSTKSPLHHQGTSIRLSGENYGDLKAGLSHYARLGKRTGLSAGAQYDHRAGYFTNQYNGKKADERNDVSGRLRLTFKHNEQAQSELHANFEHSRQNGYPYRQYHKDTGKMDSVNYDDPSSYTRDLLSAGYRFTYNTGWGNIRAISSYQYIKDNQEVDQDFLPTPVVSATQIQKQNMFSQEVIAQSDFSKNYRWVSGLFGFMQQIDKAVDAFMKPAAMHDVRDYDQPAYGLAAYHQSSYNNLLTKGLSLTFGVRLDYEKNSQKYVNNIVTTAATAERANTDFSLNFFELLPKMSLRYEFLQQAIYISVAKGYKTGGFNASFNTESEQTFDPETSWNYETGIKLNLPANTTVNASVFYIDWTKQQITQAIVLQSGSGGSLIRNAGRSVSKGFELSVNTSPLQNLNLDVNYGYTDARFKDYRYSETVDYSTNRIPLVPQHTLAAGASYRLIVGKKLLDDITFHTNYNVTGKLYWQENNTVAQNSYGLLNAGIGFGKGIVHASIWAKNILNKSYHVYYFDIIQPPLLNASYVQQGRPFTAGIDIRIDL
jgi:outer membrane receptor protein involved in Fe transport